MEGIGSQVLQTNEVTYGVLESHGRNSVNLWVGSGGGVRRLDI